MAKIKVTFKKGAASFYIVAFSTLIMVIIAASFSAVVLSEMAKSENDELSQSAYDAALAGIEDAKIAFANYQECLQKDPSYRHPSAVLTCGEIIELVNAGEDCGMVAKILARNPDGGEVMIEERTDGRGGVTNNMQQAYTCVKINTVLSNYASTLNEDDPIRIVRVRLNGDVKASDINRIKVSWYSTEDFNVLDRATTKYAFPNWDVSDNTFRFPAVRNNKKAIAIPPIISVGLVQTAENFSLNDFEKTSSNQTNRGTLFLVPTDRQEIATKSDVDNYTGVWKENKNVVTASQIVKSNNRAVNNVPFAVYCRQAGEASEAFACSTWLELPEPIGGNRNSDTFIVSVSLPYMRPQTSFSLEFFCSSAERCGGTSDMASLNGMQIGIDSTGRANNLFRRVSARLESSDTYFPFPLYGIELLDDSSDDTLLKKPSVITCEYDWWTGFDPQC